MKYEAHHIDLENRLLSCAFLNGAVDHFQISHWLCSCKFNKIFTLELAAEETCLFALHLS